MKDLLMLLPDSSYYKQIIAELLIYDMCIDE